MLLKLLIDRILARTELAGQLGQPVSNRCPKFSCLRETIRQSFSRRIQADDFE